MKKAWVFVLFLISVVYLQGQNLEWIKGFEKNSFATDGNYIPTLVTDRVNNTYALGVLQNTGLGTTASTKSTIIKYNKRGDKYWHKNFNFIIDAMAVDDSCNLYMVALVRKTTQIGNDVYGTRAYQSIVLIKADSSLNIEWSRLVTDRANVQADYSRAERYTNITVTQSDVILRIISQGWFYFKDIRYETAAPFYYDINIFLRLEKKKSPSNKEWCSVLDLSDFMSTRLLIGDMQVDGNGSIVFKVTNLDEDFMDRFHFNHKGNYTMYYSESRSYIMKISIADGSLADVIYMDVGEKAEMYTLSVLPSGKLFITGGFKGTLNYRGKKLITSATAVTAFFMLLTGNGDPIWLYAEDNSGTNGCITPTHTVYRNGKIHGIGIVSDAKTGINGMAVDHTAGGNKLVFKMDTLGNCLWAFTIGGSLIIPRYEEYYVYPHAQAWLVEATESKALSVDNDGSVYLTDNFHYRLIVLDTVLKFQNQSNNAALYKLGDYAIYRGDVYPGPYCAGDTIRIPYTLLGPYDTANVFIAQLSDENGNFTGGERELGRLKSNRPGEVIGMLPLFNVETSGQYRIRILSTRPIVQSDYVYDTLRLLIYSRDSANAGPDTLVCTGSSIRLKTTGGSKWIWSPAASLNNPHVRNPVATPVADTEYRIIISDSSGCGDTDTDYVKVVIKYPHTISAPFTDTLLCHNQKILLNAVVAGGNTSYSVSWFTNNNLLFVGDSLKLNPAVAGEYYAVKTERCTKDPDTVKININVRPPLSVKIITPDSICGGRVMVLQATVSGGNPAGYNLLWEKSNSGWRSDQNPAVDTPANNITYWATLADNCSPIVKDSITARILPVPVANFSWDTTLGCPPLKVTFTDLSTGNDTLLNSWVIRSAANAGGRQYVHEFLTPGTYDVGLRVSNRSECSDYVVKNNLVTVYHKPNARFLIKPEIKETESPVLLYNQSSGATSFTWDFGDGNFLFQDDKTDATHIYADTGTKQIRLVAQNERGCVDTQLQIIRVFDKINCIIPNAFTPNGDYLNPGFGPVCIGVENYTLTIYNRWGEVIHECQDCLWDGTFNYTPVPMGVYMYKLQLHAHSRQKSLVYGIVNVIR